MKIFFILIFSSFSALFSNAQSLPQVFDYAKKQQHNQHYLDAILTYQRVIFFDKNEEYFLNSYQNIASCYTAINDFESAAKYYDLAYFISTNLDEKIDLIFKKSFCLIKQQNYQYALLELFNVSENLSIKNQQKLSFYKAICNYGLGNYIEAEADFLNSIENNEQQQIIKTLFKRVAKVSKINPKTSKILSSIIPGLGQFYNSDFKNGANSLLLLSAFGYLFVNTAINYSLLDAAVSVLPWFQRYYMGGYSKAEQIAISRKSNKLNHLKNQIIQVISNNRE